jgi:putative transposase
VYRYRAEQPVELSAAHSCFDLSHHLVVSTRLRRAVFDSVVGHQLGEYWWKVSAKYGFALERITILPDHAHLLVKTAPKFNLASSVLALMNNGEYFICKNFPQIMAEEHLDQLWQPSAYVGTCGKDSTALVKAWLSSPVG